MLKQLNSCKTKNKPYHAANIFGKQKKMENS